MLITRRAGCLSTISLRSDRSQRGSLPMADSSDGRAGYNRPPRETQFKKGQSGNPSGRRKAAPTSATDLAEALRESTTLHEKGRERKITKQRSLNKTLT